MEASELRMRFSTSGEESAKSAIRGVDSQIDTLGNSANTAKSRLGGMFQVAGGIIGAQLISHVAGWAGSLLMASANAEQAHMSLETVTGSAEKADAIFKNIQEFAKATPFSFPELVQSTISLEAFGLKSAEWLPIIGDTASAMSKSVDQVTQAVLDASSGQYERLKELGIMTSVEGDKLTFSYMKNGKMITETVDRNNKEIVGSTIASIWSDKYEGAMERQSKSFIGQYSTLKDNIMMSMQSASSGVFGFATEALGFFNDIFAVGLGQAVENLGIDLSIHGVISLAGDLLDAAGDLWGWLRRKLFVGEIGSGDGTGPVGQERVLPWATTIIDGAINLAGDLFDAAGDLWSWVKVKLFGDGNLGMGDGTGQRGSLAPISFGDVFVTGYVKLSGDFANFADAIDRELKLQVTETQLERARQSGEETGKAFAEKVADGVRSGSDIDVTGGEGAGGIWENIKKILVWEPSIFRESQPTYIDAAFQWAQGVGQGVHDAIVSGISSAISGGQAKTDVPSQFFSGATQNPSMGWVTEMVSGWLQPLTDALNGVGAAIDTSVDFSTTLFDKGGELIDGLWDGTSAQWDNFVTGWLEGLPQRVLDWTPDMSGALYSTGWNVAWGLAEGIKNGAYALVQPAVDVINGIINGIQDFVNPGSPSRRFLPVGYSIPWGIGEGMMGGLSHVTNASSAISGSYNFPSRSSIARSGSQAGMGGNTYVFYGPVGRDAENWIDEKIANGQGKRVDRSVGRSRITESM